MLLNLTISDLAVVKSLNLDLQGGMSILTGETGAGKSILLTALGLALGDRADSSYIRPGCKRAEINLSFDLTQASSAKLWLKEFELDDHDECLIRRIINADGRSKAYINNRPVTLQALQALSEKLVEIHGQHAHLTLLHADEQRKFLDESTDSQSQVHKLNAVFQQWKLNREELDLLISAAQDQTAREELLSFQLNELQQLDLDNFNYDLLTQEHALQANLSNILENGQAQLDVLYENELQSVNQQVHQSVQVLTELSNLAPELHEITTMLVEAQIQIEEASQQLRRFLEAQEADPQRMQWLDNQLAIIHDLSRKHHVPAEGLPDHFQSLQEEFNNLTHSSERIETLQAIDQQLQQEYGQLAEQLSESRKKHAAIIQAKISAMMHELGMPQGQFIISVTPLAERSPRINGQDKIEFLVSANPGHPPQPLAKVASGGELSRISLAIQVSMSPDKKIPTMIFDEVDSGIGGGIAEIVGKKLHHLSKNRQVMCVTHLPQVASQADHHLFVAKSNAADITTSNVRTLSSNERIKEVARMLGGVNITDNTLAHAREMIESGKKTTH